jgi:hypothetical protein
VVTLVKPLLHTEGRAHVGRFLRARHAAALSGEADQQGRGGGRHGSSPVAGMYGVLAAADALQRDRFGAN